MKANRLLFIHINLKKILSSFKTEVYVSLNNKPELIDVDENSRCSAFKHCSMEKYENNIVAVSCDG